MEIAFLLPPHFFSYSSALAAQRGAAYWLAVSAQHYELVFSTLGDCNRRRLLRVIRIACGAANIVGRGEKTRVAFAARTFARMTYNKNAGRYATQKKNSTIRLQSARLQSDRPDVDLRLTRQTLKTSCHFAARARPSTPRLSCHTFLSACAHFAGG